MTQGQAHIFLYGPPASGKTSLGRRLASALSRPFCDLDALIEEQAGASIPDIFAQEGEAGFRRREAAALAAAVARPPMVIALGGGALLDPQNRRLAEAAGPVVCLQARFETILARLVASAGGRPLLDGDAQARLQALLDQRAGHYASFLLQFPSDGAAPEALAARLQIELGRFRVEGMGPGYDIRIADDALAQLGRALQARDLRGPLALATDETVAALHVPAARSALQAAGYEVTLITIPPGEQHKTLDTVGRLWAGFLGAGLERGSTVVALGGGVVGDLAGFAAATYLRGVAWVAVPTTLLAMVDASLGGKTGADLPQGKNLVGVFHPPALVWADPRTLDSLPEVEIRNGLAEVVKHGLLGDPALFELCRRGWAAARADLSALARRAAAVKVEVIRRDPYEQGERASLNLGHTLGHALERASGYGLRHGEAVAIGMAAAARLSERRGLAEAGLAEAVCETLAGLGLPTAIPAGLDEAEIRAGMGVDKKRSGGALRLVLPLRVGAACWGVALDDPAELMACGRGE